MKKVILSIAIVAGMVLATNVQKVHAIEEQPSVTMVMEDDGFVEVQLEDLSEVVQAAIRNLAQEYDVNALKYNAEKQLTKVELTNKEDQSTKTVYLDAEGKEVEAPTKAEEVEAVEQETPSVGFAEVMQDNGFVNVKFDVLNEKVQDAVRTIAGSYDVTSLRYNVDQKITEVKGVSKEDQTEKVFYLDDEGKEVEKPAAQEQVEQQQEETEEVPMLL